MATFDELGYAVAFHGDGRWNGVAIASRLGLANVERGSAPSSAPSEHFSLLSTQSDDMRA